jgi:hypothetical protein
MGAFPSVPATAHSVAGEPAVNLYQTGPGVVQTSSGPHAGYSWMVAILPFIERLQEYQNLANVSQKFRFPAFQMVGGQSGAGASMGIGCRFNGGGPAATPWWRHFSTIELDEIRCPSFSGEPVAAHNNYNAYSAVNQVNPPNPQPANPWFVVNTNYKAMCATHFACMNQNVPQYSMTRYCEKPNGILIPPDDPSSRGIGIRSIIDGTSKTILLAESKEQRISSWYDGCGAWPVACAAGNLTLNNCTAASAASPLQPVRNTVTPAGSSITMYYWSFDPLANGQTGLNYGPKNDPTKKFLADIAPPIITPGGNAGYANWEWGPSSDHPGVVLHAWADAHVSSIEESVDPVVYVQLVTRAGREPVSDPGQE